LKKEKGDRGEMTKGSEGWVVGSEGVTEGSEQKWCKLVTFCLVVKEIAILVNREVLPSPRDDRM
jgi:hypothetical protein